MEHIELILSAGRRGRINRIKDLRFKQSGIILADQEIIAAAIDCYWLVKEKQAADVALAKGKKNVADTGRKPDH